ncbi:uncharacterized protein LOC135957184 [Calliphora vicina]|uniref:uncharacterized protein LOC135957184 n=1 Tax=Calliphora vicina TaxID=7373 RepID=UPI00325B1793
MAKSENIEDWDQPIPTPEESSEDFDEKLTFEKRQHNNNLNKLKEYVELMAYRPVKPPHVRPYTDSLSKPKKRSLVDNAKQFSEFMVPLERGKRLKRLASKHDTITVEQLEQIIRSEKTKERQKEDTLKRKQEIYYEMLTKLELQCRTQYLNVMLKKFANFIAKLATTLRIPATLVDPYARMQRGIFCNILQSIGVEQTTQAGIYYNTKEGSEYEVCHKLSHALLSLIIKALDLASTRNPDEIQPVETDFKMDNYIKERLLSAAEKKIQSKKLISRTKLVKSDTLDSKLEKCVPNVQKYL